ncbi:hypothetical protein KEG38_15140 [Polyangium jinanense]|uniref:hypothetical protein n=1 Tax=Polyangium jinanense TaxID=2829994 RepID=UPI00233FF4D4|nr:hypothetical protein [Polyangium jinanense]MDC3955199.1 hypothetical protein [Polyangium jinanense]
MTTTLRLSTSLASALLVTSMALHTSAAEPREHALSATIGLTPLYFGEAVGFTDGGGDYFASANEPLLFGLSADYMRSYGLVRVGVGLRYETVQDMDSHWPRGWQTFSHELGISGLLSLGGTTRSGVDIAATLGLGIGHSWIPNFDLYPPSWGGTGELLVSVAIPVTQASDFFLRSGMSVAFYIGNMTQEGEYPRPDAVLRRAYFPFELGFRRRF